MGLVHFGIPPQLLHLATQKCGVKAFVETGTFRGDTTAFAADHFQKVFTIEFTAERFQKAVQRFANQRNVTCLQGNSPDGIRKIAPELKDVSTLFWLDAHWNGDGESREYECPVADEIRVINDANLDAYILVDDARYFMAPPPPPHDTNQWPSLPELISMLSHGNRRFVIVLDDIIAAWPMSARPQLTGYAQERQMAMLRANSITAPITPPGGPVFVFNRKP